MPSEAYLIMSTLLILPGLIALTYLALSGRLERIEHVKYVVVEPGDEPDDPTDSSSRGGSQVEGRPSVKGRCTA